MREKIALQLKEIQSTFNDYKKRQESGKLKSAYGDLKSILPLLKSLPPAERITLLQLEEFVPLVLDITTAILQHSHEFREEIVEKIYLPLQAMLTLHSSLTLITPQLTLLLKLADAYRVEKADFFKNNYADKALIYYYEGFKLAIKHHQPTQPFLHGLSTLEKSALEYVAKRSVMAIHKTTLLKVHHGITKEELVNYFEQADHYCQPLLTKMHGGCYNVVRELYQALHDACDSDKCRAVRESGELKQQLETLFLDRLIKIKQVEKTYAADPFFLQSKAKLKRIRQSLPLFMQANKQLKPQARLAFPENIVAQVASTQNDLVDALKNHLHEMMAYCVEAAGSPPLGFNVLWLGSATQGNVTPYSDIEFAILVERKFKDQVEESYFKRLIELIHFQINLYGEWENELNTHLGFCADPNATPLSEVKLCDTPESLATNFNPSTMEKISLHDGMGYALFQPMMIYASANADENLFQCYENNNKKNQQETLYDPTKNEENTLENYSAEIVYPYLTQALPLYQARALACLKQDVQTCEKNQTPLTDNNNPALGALFDKEKYTPLSGNYHPLGKTFCIKKRLVKPLSYFISDIRLFYGLEAKTVDESITALCQANKVQTSRFHASFGEELRQALALLNTIRFRQQDYYQQQRQPELVIIPGEKNSEQLYELNEKEYQVIQAIELRLLRPFYYVLSHWIRASSIIENLTTLQQFDAVSVAMQMAIERYAVAEMTVAELAEIEILAAGLIATLQHRQAKAEAYMEWYPKLANLPVLKIFQETVAHIVNTLHREQAHEKRYVDYYRQLPTSYRSFFITALQALHQNQIPFSLLSVLNTIPNPDGTRVLTKEKQKRWEAVLLQQLVCDEKQSATQQTMDDASGQCVITWLSEQGIEKQRIPQTIVDQLFLKEGKINEANRIKIEGIPIGRRIVIPVYDKEKNIIAYAKFYPEFPGIQTLVNELGQRLEGASAQVTLAHVQHPKVKQAYSILFSQPVKITLFDELKNKGTLRHLDDELDPYFYTLTFLKEIALLLEDNKEDNIGLAEELNPEGVLGKRLISFDSDHALIEPLVERGKIKKEEKVQAKSVVFCFKKKMQCELTPQAVIDFLSLQMNALLKQTAAVLQHRDSYYVGAETLQGEPIFSHFADYLEENKANSFCCIATTFEMGSISHLYQRLLRMQSALQTMLDAKQSLTHLAFFKLIEPGLAFHYEKALNQYATPEAIFHALPTEYVEKVIGKLVIKQSVHSSKQRLMNSLTVVDELKRKTLRDLIKEKKYRTPWHMEAELKQIDHYYEIEQVTMIVTALQQGNVQPFIAMGLHAYDTKERVIAKLDWSKIELKTQQHILNAMQGTRFYRLKLANCIALTDELLKLIVTSSKQLQEIDVSGCTQLTQLTMLNTCKHLRVLIANRLPKVMNVSDTLIFPQLMQLFLQESALQTLKLQAPLLQTLTVSHSPQLQIVSVQAPELRHLQASDCKMLITLSLGSTHLETIDLTGCHQLPESQLMNLALSSYSIRTLTLKGCDLINHQDFREHYPFLLAVRFNEESDHFMVELSKVLGVIKRGNRSLLADETFNKILVDTFKDWQKEGQTIVSQLIKMLGDKDSMVRLSAAQALGPYAAVFSDSQRQVVAEALLQALRKDSWEVRLDVAQAFGPYAAVLSDSQCQVVAETLLQALRDGNWWVRRDAARALGLYAAVLSDSQRQAVTEALLQALRRRDNESEVRMDTVDALDLYASVLSESQRQVVVEDLLEALWAGNSDVRRDAAQALGPYAAVLLDSQRQEVVLALLLALENEKRQVRQGAAQALGPYAAVFSDNQRQAVAEALLQALRDEDSYVRRDAAQALVPYVPVLSDSQRQVVAEALLQALRDEDSNVRQNAAQALGSYAAVLSDSQRQVMVKALLQALRDYDSHVRQAAVQALAPCADVLLDSQRQAVVEALLSALRDGDSDVRKYAAQALVSYAPVLLDSQRQAVAEALLQALRNGGAYIRKYAAQVLVSYATLLSDGQHQTVVEALLQALRDGNSVVRWGTMQALVPYAPVLPDSQRQAVVGALLQALRDEDSYVRRDAAQALVPYVPVLSDSQRQVVAEALLQALRDEDSNVRQNAAQTLGSYAAVLSDSQRQAVVGALLQALRGEDSYVRRDAAKALGSYVTLLSDSQRQVVAEALLQALRHGNSDVQYVAQALGALGGFKTLEAWLQTAVKKAIANEVLLQKPRSDNNSDLPILSDKPQGLFYHPEPVPPVLSSATSLNVGNEEEKKPDHSPNYATLFGHQ